MTVFWSAFRRQWRYDFRVGGTRHQGPCVDPQDDGAVATNKTEAKRIEEKIRVGLRELSRGRTTTREEEPLRFAEAVVMGLDAIRGGEQHRRNMAACAVEVLTFFGPETVVQEIAQDRVEEYRKFCASQTIKVYVGGPRKMANRGDPKIWRDTGRPREAITANNYLEVLRGAFAAAHKAKDRFTQQSKLPNPPVVEAFPEFQREPTPAPEVEIASRTAVAPPWTQDVIQLCRLFGLRRAEALKVEIRHVRFEEGCLLFRAEEVKGRKDERVWGGRAGVELLQRLVAQARKRGVTHLVTWPGRYWNKDDKPPQWGPLKSIRRSWKTTAKAAAIEHPHRLHDVRAKYVTELAREAPGAVVQQGARHKDWDTTKRYIGLAQQDVSDAVNAAHERRTVIAADGNALSTKFLTEVPYRARRPGSKTS